MASKSKGKKKVLLIKGFRKFSFPNGDTYDGEYEANLKLKTIAMNGSGIYKTFYGHVYEGNWIKDKLSTNDKSSITYPDNNRFFGILSNHQYSLGTYCYFDGSMINGTFEKNLPTNAVFIDRNKHIWNVQVSEKEIYLSIPNIFSLDDQNVNEDQEEEELQNEDDNDDDDSDTTVTYLPKKKNIF